MATRSKTNYDGLLLRGTTWHLRFTVKGVTVAESTHTSNRREAERIRDKRRSDLVQEVVLAGKKPIRLHAAIDLFLRSRQHLPSHQNCEIHMRYFRAAPDHYLDRVTDEELNAVLTSKRAEGYKESTLKVSVAYFNAMIRHVGDLGYTVRKKMKPIKHDSGKIRWMTKDELAKLYVAIDPAYITSDDEVLKAQRLENFDLVRLLYETGARYSEIALLRWTQVDLVAGTVHIKRAKGSVDGVLNMTKTMREILTRRRQMEKGDVVFSSKQRQNNESKWMRAAVARAALDQTHGTVTIHTLRHTKAVHLLNKGLNLLELQKFLGHKTIQSTMVYAHVIEDEVMAKAARLTNEA